MKRRPGQAASGNILRRVLAGEHSVSVLAAKYDMSFAAVQKHVAVLEKAGLLTKRRSGREQLASGEVAAVRPVAARPVAVRPVSKAGWIDTDGRIRCRWVSAALELWTLSALEK